MEDIKGLTITRNGVLICIEKIKMTTTIPYVS